MASIKHEEYTHKGRRVILDAAEIFPGEYETMILRASDGEEIDSKTTRNKADAIAAFDAFRKAYPPDGEALTGRYAKLRDDLRKALAAGVAAEEEDPEDGGTCNLDSAAIYLPRWNARKVQQAAKEAGTRCSDWNLFGQKHFVFFPITHAQANARSRNAEAVTKSLQSMGYDAIDYCHID